MISTIRKQFNSSFSEEKYQNLVNYFQDYSNYKTGFRISESPIFIPKELSEEIYQSAEEIIDQILNNDIISQNAIPEHLSVPNEKENFHFLVLDFGICQDNDGKISPKLIELQAFPSLFFYQLELKKQVEKQFNIPRGFSILPHQKFDSEKYILNLKKLIVSDFEPENVILLEINPKKQKTGIDFALTEENIGIKTVDLTEIHREGRDLYYLNDGVTTPIYRIYNRVIFDELMQNQNLKSEFNLIEDVDVEWVTHPNWFFKISKYLLPKLKNPNVPKTFFLNDFPSTEKLDDYVLKPLFSFAGQGVKINPTSKDIQSIQNKEHYILQKKVDYAPIFEDINRNFAKAEIRLLYTWLPGQHKPELQINLARMTKSDMVNVDNQNADNIWTGSSIAYFEV